MPGPGEIGSIRVMLDDDETNLLPDEGVFKELFNGNRLFMDDNALWMWENDEQAIEWVREFIPGAFMHDTESMAF